MNRLRVCPSRLARPVPVPASPHRRGGAGDAALRGDDGPPAALEAHSAVSGLLFYTGTQFPADYRGDPYVATHGSGCPTGTAGGL